MHLLEQRQTTAAASTSPTSSSLSSTGTVKSATNPPRPQSSTDLGSLPPSSTIASPTRSPSSSSTSSPGSGQKSSGPSSTVVIALVIAFIIFLLLITTWYCLRRARTKHKNPRYVPTAFLKRLWEKWDPEPVHYRLPDTNDQAHLEPQRGGAGVARTSVRGGLDAAAEGGRERDRRSGNTVVPAAAAAAGGVDRNTSVRSVMTLPAYHPSARESEQVLGREGERGGIDVVVEFPEGVDEEEERREAEMEALYQVRVARRRENEEREERRRLRREARERGDYVALRELQARARAGSSTSAARTVEELRAEHDRIKKERQRAVSSVSYAELGVARHDGTRLRANSNDSEREGLLGDAASIAASSRYHRRDRSASSVLSIDTMNDDLSPSVTRSRTSSNARPESPLRRLSSSQSQQSQHHEGRAGSSPEMIEHEDMPPNSPPGYEHISLEDGRENPPDYSSPVLGRGESIPMFDSPQTSTPRPTLSPDGRRGSSGTHIGQLMQERRASSTSSLGTAGGSGTPRSSRLGLGGVPQLPSLRLGTLPSIQVDGPSPTVRRGRDGNGDGDVGS